MKELWILLVGILLFVWYFTQNKQTVYIIQPKKHDFYKEKRPQESSFKMTNPVPPLPLSTMYTIRIGRQTLGRKDPNDPVWNYDHSTGMGPNY